MKHHEPTNISDGLIYAIEVVSSVGMWESYWMLARKREQQPNPRNFKGFWSESTGAYQACSKARSRVHWMDSFSRGLIEDIARRTSRSGEFRETGVGTLCAIGELNFSCTFRLWKHPEEIRILAHRKKLVIATPSHNRCWLRCSNRRISRDWIIGARLCKIVAWQIPLIETAKLEILGLFALYSIELPCGIVDLNSLKYMYLETIVPSYSSSSSGITGSRVPFYHSRIL